MDADTLLWGWLPMIIGAAAASVSLFRAIRHPSPFQLVAALVVVTGVVWSEWMLYRIVSGGWPTFLPHIVIAFVLLLVFIQTWHSRRR